MCEQLPSTIFWSMVALPTGLALGLFICAMFGIDLTEVFRKKDDGDE